MKKTCETCWNCIPLVNVDKAGNKIVVRVCAKDDKRDIVNDLAASCPKWQDGTTEMAKTAQKKVKRRWAS